MKKSIVEETIINTLWALAKQGITVKVLYIQEAAYNQLKQDLGYTFRTFIESPVSGPVELIMVKD